MRETLGGMTTSRTRDPIPQWQGVQCMYQNGLSLKRKHFAFDASTSCSGFSQADQLSLALLIIAMDVVGLVFGCLRIHATRKIEQFDLPEFCRVALPLNGDVAF